MDRYTPRPMASPWPPFPNGYRTAPDIPTDIDFYRDINVARPTFQARSPPATRRSRERRFRSRSPPRDENNYYRNRNQYQDADMHYQTPNRQRLRNDDNWNRNINQARTYHDNGRSVKRSPNESYRTQRHRKETYKDDIHDDRREDRSPYDYKHTIPDRRPRRSVDIIRRDDTEISNGCIGEKDPLLSTEDVSSDELKDDNNNAETEDRIISKQTDNVDDLLISVQIGHKESKHVENKENIYAGHRESVNEQAIELAQSCVPTNKGASNEQRYDETISLAKGDINIEIKALEEKIKAQKAKLKKQSLKDSPKKSGNFVPETTNDNMKNDEHLDHSVNNETNVCSEFNTIVSEGTLKKSSEKNSDILKFTSEPKKDMPKISLENKKQHGANGSLRNSCSTFMTHNAHVNGLETNRKVFSPSQPNGDGTNREIDTCTANEPSNQKNRSIKRDNNMGKLNQTFQELQKNESIAGLARQLKEAVFSIGQSVNNTTTVAHCSNANISDKIAVAVNRSDINTETEASISAQAHTEDAKVCAENSTKSSDSELGHKAKTQCGRATSQGTQGTLSEKQQTKSGDTHTFAMNGDTESDRHSNSQEKYEGELIGQPNSKLGQHPKSPTEPVSQLKPNSDPSLHEHQKQDTNTVSVKKLNKTDSKPKIKQPVRMNTIEKTSENKSTSEHSNKEAKKSVPVKNKALSKTTPNAKDTNSNFMVKEKGNESGEQFVRKPEMVITKMSSTGNGNINDKKGQLPRVSHTRRLSGTNCNANNASIIVGSESEDKDRKSRLSAPCEVVGKQQRCRNTTPEKTPDGKYIKLGEKESIKDVEKRKEIFKKLKHSEKENSHIKISDKLEQTNKTHSFKPTLPIKKCKTVSQDVAKELGKGNDLENRVNVPMLVERPNARSKLEVHSNSESCPVSNEYMHDESENKLSPSAVDDVDMDDVEIIDLGPFKPVENAESTVKPDVSDMTNFKEHGVIRYCDDRVVFKGSPTRKKFIERLKPLTFSDDSGDEKRSQKSPQKALKRKRKQKVHKPMLLDFGDSSDNDDLPESPFKITKKDKENNYDNTLIENIDILPGMNKFLKIDKAVYEKGFEIRHDKILENDEIITTFGFLKPEYLYVKPETAESALLGKCVRCSRCNQYFNPLAFTAHHDEASVAKQIANDKCSMMDFTLCTSDLFENIREVFKHFQDYFHQLRSKRRLSQSDAPQKLTAFSSPPVRENIQVGDGAGSEHAFSTSDSSACQATPSPSTPALIPTPDVETTDSVKGSQSSICYESVSDTCTNVFTNKVLSIEVNSSAEPVQRQDENKSLTSSPIFDGSTPLFNSLTLPLLTNCCEITPLIASTNSENIHEDNDENTVVTDVTSPTSNEPETGNQVNTEMTIESGVDNEASSTAPPDSDEVDDIEKKRSEVIDNLCRLYGINTTNRYANVALLVTALHIDNTKRYIEDMNKQGNHV